MSSSYIQEDISETREAEVTGRAVKKFEILKRCGIKDCYVAKVGNHRLDSPTPDFAVYGLYDDRIDLYDDRIDIDQLVKIKILSGYDLKSICPYDPHAGGLCLYFGRGYKSGAVKRLITGETL